MHCLQCYELILFGSLIIDITEYTYLCVADMQLVYLLINKEVQSCQEVSSFRALGNMSRGCYLLAQVTKGSPQSDGDEPGEKKRKPPRESALINVIKC